MVKLAFALVVAELLMAVEFVVRKSWDPLSDLAPLGKKTFVVFRHFLNKHCLGSLLAHGMRY